jgi:general secretion pathway protein G
MSCLNRKRLRSYPHRSAGRSPSPSTPLPQSGASGARTIDARGPWLAPEIDGGDPRALAVGLHARYAFTLVELMVVLVILALLSGVVSFSVRGYLIKSKQNIAKVEISKMMQALDTFYTTFDRYPNNEEGLNILAARTEDFPEGILSLVPKDPWNHPYEYRNPGANAPYEIVCYGADHRNGGEGADRDITSVSISRGGK